MKTLILSLTAALALVLGATGANAACYADYKAKRDNPLKLHYGVIEVSAPCTVQAATPEIAARLAGKGWTLLNVLSVFDETGLAQRKDSAGKFFLRF